MANLSVIQERFDEEITTWYVFSSKAKAQKKFNDLESEYEEDWQLEMNEVSGSNCGFLIGFDDYAGEIFAEPVSDVRGYSLDSSLYAGGNTTAILIGPKSKEGELYVTSMGALEVKGNLEELAEWMASDLTVDNIPAGVPGAEQGSGKSSKFIPDNYSDILNTVKVMKDLWNSTKKENKKAEAVKAGLPTEYWGDVPILDFQHKWVWFINVLNGALLKCTNNQIYSDLEDWKYYKKNKNFFSQHDNFIDKPDGLYSEWPKNIITKDVNKIVAAAKKDQEVCFKATYLLVRDFLGRMDNMKDDEWSGRYVDKRGNRGNNYINTFRYMQQAWAFNIIDKIEDDKSVLKVDSHGDVTFSFESVQTTSELKYVQLFEQFVDKLNEEQEYALYEKKYSAAERRELEKKGHAMPGGRFPIVDLADLRNAIFYIGKGVVNGPEEAAKFIAKRMKELDGLKYEDMFNNALSRAGVKKKVKDLMASV